MPDTPVYEICYKDICAFRINPGSGEVRMINEQYIPFGAFPEESDDFDDRLNNIVDFQSWCSGRILPLDRQYAKAVLNHFGFSQHLTDRERAKIALVTRCLSLDDCYWVRRQGEDISWDDVSLFRNTLDNAVFEVALTGKTLTVTRTEVTNPDIATDGKAAKAWQRTGDGFYLLKADHDGSVEKEVEASQILKKLGLPCVEYKKETFGGVPVSRCRCFTSESVNFVRAQWYALWCMNHNTDISDMICHHKDQFDQMNLADYLVGNADEHPENWGFLYDNERNILGLNPDMDFDHAFEGMPLTACGPMLMLGIRQTQEDCAKDIVARHPDWLDFGTDLSEFHYGDFVKERLDTLQDYLREQEPVERE
jgi:hypothetical protein